MDGKLFKNGRQVNRVYKWKDAIVEFHDWIKEQILGPEVVLVAHNGHESHAKWLIRDLLRSQIFEHEIEDNIMGFADTMRAFQNQIPSEPRIFL